jgi:hypothetical protein
VNTHSFIVVLVEGIVNRAGSGNEDKGRSTI